MLVNLGPAPLPLPDADVLATSAPGTSGSLPTDHAVWLGLRPGAGGAGR